MCFHEEKRSENAGYTKRRQVIAKLGFTPLVGCEASEAGRIGAAVGIGGRVIFADFSSRKPGKIFRKNSDSLYAYTSQLKLTTRQKIIKGEHQ